MYPVCHGCFYSTYEIYRSYHKLFLWLSVIKSHSTHWYSITAAVIDHTFKLFCFLSESSLLQVFPTIIPLSRSVTTFATMPEPNPSTPPQARRVYSPPHLLKNRPIPDPDNGSQVPSFMLPISMGALWKIKKSSSSSQVSRLRVGTLSPSMKALQKSKKREWNSHVSNFCL